VKHTKRVERLICLGPAYTSGSESVRRLDWSTWRRVLAGISYPNGPIEDQRKFSRTIADSVSRDVLLKYFESHDQMDQERVYSELRVPTLVIGMPQERHRQHAESLAAAADDARIVVVDDRWGVTGGRTAALLCLEFMGIEGSQARELVSETAIVLFTDIADSTALTEQMGDSLFRASARVLDGQLRTAIRDAGGTPVEGKVLGDGVMGVFSSAAQAIDAARRCVEASDERGLGLHVGLHAGDVIREDDNVYGGAVNIASRVCGLSAPGEVLVTDVVRGLARTSTAAGFEDRGEQSLKGISDAVRLFEVRWRK
jgi:class 3 adenylate cyclase